MFKVIYPFYDINNPEKVFDKNTIIKVNDVNRGKELLDRKVVVEAPDSDDFVEFDPKEKSGKEVESNKELDSDVTDDVDNGVESDSVEGAEQEVESDSVEGAEQEVESVVDKETKKPATKKPATKKPATKKPAKKGK